MLQSHYLPACVRACGLAWLLVEVTSVVNIPCTYLLSLTYVSVLVCFPEQISQMFKYSQSVELCNAFKNFSKGLEKTPDSSEVLFIIETQGDISICSPFYLKETIDKLKRSHL